MTARVEPTKVVRVWDAPTRIFHWAMVALVIVAWLTGESDGLGAQAHRYAGEAMAGLLVFRLLWGFIGGEHARFSAFLPTPSSVWSHARGMLRGKSHRTLGHNPLGALAVFALLVSVSVVVVTGLLSVGEEGSSGPLAPVFGINLADAHELSFRILQGLVVLHLIGVAVTSLASWDNLVAAMISGAKRRPQNEAAIDASTASVTAVMAAVLLSAAAALALMTMPHPAGWDADGEGSQFGRGEIERGDEYEEHDP